MLARTVPELLRHRYGCPDADGDGYSNPDVIGHHPWFADAFNDQASQWADTDGDGYGDNQSESLGDPMLAKDRWNIDH